jgi:hypothetical protein
MGFVEMDQELLLRLLEGTEDELSGEVKALDAMYRQFICPQCGGRCQKEFDRRHAFSDPATLVPRALLRCVDCSCLFDPHSGLRLETGNIGKIPVPSVIIRPRDE